jgi:hypothetical protein
VLEVVASQVGDLALVVDDEDGLHRWRILGGGRRFTARHRSVRCEVS